ncbi:Zn(II)2Cys6 transcription factor [Staphylococcus aureus]|nr:Zn(II)2Cys6 transcription factor [Staphylococcus aureus]
MIPKSAGRTPIACSNCAKTKTKCDKKFPCSRCAGRNLRCTLRPTRRSSKNANRMGLITAETIASCVANGILPPDQTVAAEAAPMPVGSPKSAEKHMHQKPSSPGSGVPTTIPEEKIMNDNSAQYFEQQPMSNGHTSPAQQISPLATPRYAFAKRRKQRNSIRKSKKPSCPIKRQKVCSGKSEKGRAIVQTHC